MATDYFAVRDHTPERAITGLVKRVWSASNGTDIDGLDFYRMEKGGWKQDNTAFTDISGQSGDAAGTPIEFDEARSIAQRLYDAGIYDYQPTVQSGG